MTTSEEIEQQTQEFLDNGGEVEVVPQKTTAEIIEDLKPSFQNNGHGSDDFRS